MVGRGPGVQKEIEGDGAYVDEEEKDDRPHYARSLPSAHWRRDLGSEGRRAGEGSKGFGDGERWRFGPQELVPDDELQSRDKIDG